MLLLNGIVVTQRLLRAMHVNMREIGLIWCFLLSSSVFNNLFHTLMMLAYAIFYFIVVAILCYLCYMSVYGRMYFFYK